MMIHLFIINVYLLACTERLVWSLPKDEIDPTASLNSHISMEPNNETTSICELVSQDLTNIITTLMQSTAAAQVYPHLDVSTHTCTFTFRFPDSLLAHPSSHYWQVSRASNANHFACSKSGAFSHSSIVLLIPNSLEAWSR